MKCKYTAAKKRSILHDFDLNDAGANDQRRSARPISEWVTLLEYPALPNEAPENNTNQA
jgi:hypothetical protein